MLRSPEFDRTRALEAAIKLFRARTHAATSLPALLDSTGIARSSFYTGFDTGQKLFTPGLAA